MDIWVTRFMVSNGGETWITTHLTEKGALMFSIEQLSDFAYGDNPVEVAEKMRLLHEYPTALNEDLSAYSKGQLHSFYNTWLREVDFSSNGVVQYEIHKTKVMV